jgi:hypothetical protein
MADLQETNQWPAGIYQIETEDPVLGGPPDLPQAKGIANVAPQQLADRTLWLKTKLDALLDGADPALDTLAELAAALNDDENFAATILARLGGLGGQAVSVSDLDVLTKTGLFEFPANAVGNPVPGTPGGIVHIENAGGRAQQFVASDNRNTYSRQRSDNTPTWTAWRRLWDDGQGSRQFADPGYEVLPSGLILQFGTATQGADTYTRVTFPIAFPNAVLCTQGIHVGSDGAMPIEVHGGTTNTGAVFRQFFHSGGASPAWLMRWLAIGH